MSAILMTRLRLGLFALAALLAVGLGWWGARLPMEGPLLDAAQRLIRAQWPQAAKTPVVVIGIDEHALDHFPEPYALWHVHLGRLLQGLASAQPRAIGLDIVLPMRSFDGLVPGYDKQLMSGLLAARRQAPVVLGVTVDAGGQERPIYAPFVSVAGGSQALGYALLPRDADGQVRRFESLTSLGGEAAPTLVGRLAQSWGLGDDAGWINPRLQVVNRYVPVEWVLERIEQGDIASLAQVFRDRAVLVGSVLRYEDRMPFAVNLAPWESDNHRQVPGVLVHAQALGSLLNGGLIHEANLMWRVLTVLALVALWWWPMTSWRLAAMLVLLAAGSYAAGLALLCAGLYMPLLPLLLAVLLGMGGRALFESVLKLHERQRLRRIFSGYVSPAVMQDILAGRLGSGLGGEERDVCVMFADVRGFTAFSETTPPAEVVALLNRYHALVADAIHAEGGTLNSIMGDGIMAIFGAPQTYANPVKPAFAAARRMLVALAPFNDELRAQGLPPISIGIGLNHGPAIVGHFGSEARHDYSAIGDTTNVASRLEGMTKALGYPLVCSASVAAALAPEVRLDPLGEQAIKGHTAIPVFGWREPDDTT